MSTWGGGEEAAEGHRCQHVDWHECVWVKGGGHAREQGQVSAQLSGHGIKRRHNCPLDAMAWVSKGRHLSWQ
jgi:hypothetical protein